MDNYYFGWIIGGIIMGLICGFIAQKINSDKGRSSGEGFLYGLFLGIIGIVVVALLPANEAGLAQAKLSDGTSRKCPYCAEIIKADAVVCRYCGKEFPKTISGKFVRLQDLEFVSFMFDCPVEIEKGALLLDTKTKEVLLQLRLNILDTNDTEISSITLKIECLDDAGDEIPDINPFNYVFRDVNLLGNKSFGDKTPIVLDPRVRKVKVGLEKAVFLNGNIRRYAGGEFTPTKQQRTNALRTDLFEQLNRDTVSLPPKSRERIRYIPQQSGNYWLCACGRPNKNSVAECCRCGIAKKWVFENISEENIQNKLERYIKKVRLLEKEKRIRSKKKKVRLILLIGFLIGFALLMVSYFFIVLPFNKYTQASNLLYRKEYDNAISLFETLGDYRNSKEMVNEANYQKANDLLSNRQYDESITIFTGLANYKNSREMINEANYQKANALLSSEHFDESITIFTSLKDYKNSIEMINEAKYQKANDFLLRKQYDESITIFTSLKDYKNSVEMNNEAKYQKALYLFAFKKYAESIDILTVIHDYKDSNNQVIIIKYAWGIQSINEKNYEKAISLFSELGSYEDSKKYLIEAQYLLASQSK